MFMKKLIDIIAADRITRLAAFISLTLILVTLGYTFFFFNSLPPFIPLYNQLGWGDPRLTDKIFIFLPIIVSLVIIIANLIITASIYTSMPLISRMFAITSLLISSLTVIFIYRVTQLIL